MSDVVESSMKQPLRRSRPRKARGQDRPQYLDSPDLDRMMVMFVSLIGEVSALRDRVDTHEALADAGIVAKTAAVEAYDLDDERQARREAEREAMLKRVLRVIFDDREAALDAGKIA